jgi:phosphatidate cytidylyltransferase
MFIGVPISLFLVFLMWLDGRLVGSPILHILVGSVLAVAVLEVYGMLSRTGADPLRTVGVGTVIVAVVVDYAFRRWGTTFPGVTAVPGARALVGFYTPMGIGAVAIVLIVSIAHLLLRHCERWVADAPATMLGIFYVWFLGSHVFAIRGLGTSGATGAGFVVAFLVAVKAGDSGAYFVGSHWGVHKLAPRTSPNKTLEGALGGLAAGVAGTMLVVVLLGLPGTATAWAVFALVVGVVAQLGDLVESALKRSVGVKDSSRMLPALGGMLDLVDSLILSAPVAFWLLLAVA